MQLGRPPRNPWRVARRCRCGKPQVIQTGPVLEDGTPFPTLWWLTCATLSARVGRLEATGLLRDVNRRLAEDPEFKQRLESSTTRFCEIRDGEGGKPVRHPGGGPDRVKCLHAHLAHHLMTGDNPVGELVLVELSDAPEGTDWEPLEPCV